MIEKGIESAQKFIENICLPASEELGLMLKDKVRIWRLNNISKIINKSQVKLEFVENNLQLKAHPRIVSEIIEKGSWQDNDEIQELWAGLLASSCDFTDMKDENIIFINILNALTVTQARIINYFTVNSKKVIDIGGQIKTEEGIILDAEEFYKIIGDNNTEKLSSEIKHLVSLGLVEEGFGLASGFFEEEHIEPGTHELTKTGKYQIGLKLSELAIRLYLKGQGCHKTGREYFKL